MGLFDFLTRGKFSRVDRREDRIWLTQAAKLNGIRADLLDCARSESVAVLLIAHFPDTLARLETLIADGPGGDVPLQPVLATNLSTDLAARLQVDESARMDLIVAERHPLPSVDDGLVRFAEELPCRTRLAVHMSLDDPLLKPFVGDWLEKMLAQLGMHEDEPIESRLVSRRIRAAQEKVADQATGNREADSAADWMAKNLP